MGKKVTVTFIAWCIQIYEFLISFVNLVRSLMAYNNSLCVRFCSSHLLICVNSLHYW